MRRRRFLCAVVAGSGFAAGCIGDGSGQDQSSPTTTEQTPTTTTEEPTTSTRTTETTTQQHTPTTEATRAEPTQTITPRRTTERTEVTPAPVPTESPEPTEETQSLTTRTSPRYPLNVSVVSAKDLSEQLQVELSAKVLRDTITPEHTAAVEIAFQNEANEPREFGFGVRWPFTSTYSDQEKWLLLAQQELEPVSRSCWAPDVPENTGFGSAAELVSENLQPDESIAKTFELWSNPSNKKCMPTGQFTWSERYEVAPGPESEDFTWDFTLEVG